MCYRSYKFHQQVACPVSFNMSLLLRICTRATTDTNMYYSIKKIFLKDSAIPQFRTQSKCLVFETLQILILFFIDGINLHYLARSWRLYLYVDVSTWKPMAKPVEWIRKYKISCSLLWIDYWISGFLYQQISLSEERSIRYTWNIQVKIFSDDDIFNNSSGL